MKKRIRQILREGDFEWTEQASNTLEDYFKDRVDRYAYGWYDYMEPFLAQMDVHQQKEFIDNLSDILDEAVDEAKEGAYEDGREYGHSEGYDDGHTEGYDEGHSDGYDRGYDEGRDNCDCDDERSDAWDDGYETGREEGYSSGHSEGYDEGQDECEECD